MQAFRKTVQDLSFQGFPLAIEILGSIDFGISDKSSDTDCVLLYYCDDDHDDHECPEDCETLQYLKTELLNGVDKYIGQDMNSRIEFLDWINLADVQDYIANNTKSKFDIVFRFLYYRTIGRPVNRPLIIQFSDALAQDRDLIKQSTTRASEILKSYLETGTHIYSFTKYNERITNNGLNLPDKLRKKLQSYLK